MGLALKKTLLWGLPLLLLACSEETSKRPGDGGGAGDGPVTTKEGPPPNKTLTWLAPESLDEERAGRNAAIASCGKVLGVAYFRALVDPVTVTCQSTLPGGGSSPKDRPAQDLYYVHFDGTDWGTPVKIDQTIGPSFGLSIAMDSSCKIYVGYLGGELGLTECSSSDAIIASSSDGGQNWTKQTVLATGPLGDTVGHWMSLAVDSSGTVHSAFRDVHFGYYEQDGNTKASLWYDTTKVSPDNGSGVYADLVFDAKDNPVIFHFNGTKSGAEGGLLLATQTGSTWMSKQLVGGATNERPSLAFDGVDTFGLAFYDPTKQTLRYTQSKDLQTWAEIEVDTSLMRKGEFSSLAFDSAGNPAISYYQCNDYGKTACDFSKDGLMFAIRQKGLWQTQDKPIDEGGPQRCGEYTSLTFVDGYNPVIAYKCVTYNNPTGEWLDTLKVIRGVYK